MYPKTSLHLVSQKTTNGDVYLLKLSPRITPKFTVWHSINPVFISFSSSGVEQLKDLGDSQWKQLSCFSPYGLPLVTALKCNTIILAIDFLGRKHNHNIKIRAQLRILKCIAIDHVLSTNICVNAVEHCIWAKQGATYTRVSQNTWGFRLWRVRNEQPLRFLLPVSRLILARLITPFLPTIFPLFLPAGLPLTLNSSFVRVYLFLNTNCLSTKISLLHLFFYSNTFLFRMPVTSCQVTQFSIG